MKTENLLPKKTLRLWQIRTLLAGMVATALLCFFTAISLWLLLPITLLALFLLVILFIILPKFFKTYKISFDESCITVSYGFIINTIHIMPYPKLVYVKTFSTPLSRRMGLTAVALKATRSVVFIPEISTENAEELVLRGGKR